LYRLYGINKLNLARVNLSANILTATSSLVITRRIVNPIDMAVR
jgi:hypothetical protein